MNHTSSLFRLPLSYLLWHYGAAWTDLFRLYSNFSWFLWNFFSVQLLLRTLIAPLHRLHEKADKRAGGFLGSLILNTLLRAVGLIMRLFTIAVGLSSILILSILFPLFLIAWFVMPLIIIASIGTGLYGLSIYL